MAYICSNRILTLGQLQIIFQNVPVAQNKCLHKIRNESIAESWQKFDFLEVVNGRIQLKRSHKC